MSVRKLIALFFVVIFSGSAGADGIKLKPSNLVTLMKAETKFREGNYRSALTLYKSIFENSPESARLNYRIGECYIHLKNKKEALKHLEKAQELRPHMTPELYLMLGRAYHMDMQLDKAIGSFNKYKQLVLENRARRNEVEKYLVQCAYAIELIKNPLNVKIHNLGAGVNSPFPDYAPSITADESSLIFTSRRENTTGGGRDPNDYGYFEDIYISSWDANSKQWGAPQSISTLNAEGHDASLSISPTGKSIFVYKNNIRGIRGGDIYESVLTADGGWQAPRPLPVSVNTPYFESSASITADGNMLFFVSERLGGFGRGDIYRCVKGPNGEWGQAENLGPVINTDEDEICSFISADGKTLYFSSRGHLSMGGYDIYRSVFENGRWSAPENLGWPINTTEDDLHFVISESGKYAYYSAIRDSGLGDRDIYMIDMSRLRAEMGILMKVAMLKGTVKDENDKGTEAKISVVDEATGKEVAFFNSGMSGEFGTTVECEKKYKLIITKEGYHPFEDSLMIHDSLSSFSYDKPVKLQRKYEQKREETEAFKYILFDLASSNLQLDDASKAKLDEVIKNIIKTPKSKIRLSGHTDNTGEPGFNKQLSVKRAQVVADYMKRKGLAASRIKIDGFGSEKPLQSNDTEEGRKYNRRVELEVTE